MSQRRKQVPATGPGVRRRVHQWWFPTLVVAVVLTLGWLTLRPSRGSPRQATRVAYAPITGPLTLPASVSEEGGNLPQLYEFVARRPDVERYLPCFCGCWRAGHKSNYDCFVDTVHRDGAVDIDRMAFT